MPASPEKTKKPAPKKPPEKEPAEESHPWKYMCIRADVHARLDEQRRIRAQRLGFKLSWTKFFVLLAEDLERAERKFGEGVEA